MKAMKGHEVVPPLLDSRLRGNDVGPPTTILRIRETACFRDEFVATEHTEAFRIHYLLEIYALCGLLYGLSVDAVCSVASLTWNTTRAN